jgi:hypothetical protein
MRFLKILVPIAMLAMFLGLAFGCSNPDNLNLPKVPNPDDEGGGDPLQPPVPTPYATPEDVEITRIIDIAFEKDGDLAFSDANSGIHLFDPFGEYRKVMSGNTVWDGMVDMGPGVGDSGMGIVATGASELGDCIWEPLYDDLSGGTFPSPAVWWWEGEAHPPDGCNPYVASGEFECPEDPTPRGIDIHPIYGWLFMKIANTYVLADDDCGIPPIPLTPPDPPMSPGIIAMHPGAPALGVDPNYYEGTYDFIIYHNQSDCLNVWKYQVPMLDPTVQTFCWDETA